MSAARRFFGRIRQVLRTILIALLGLLGLALVAAGLWFAWRGAPLGAMLMPLCAGGMLAGCAWWLLFRSPPPAPEPVRITIPKRVLRRAGPAPTIAPESIRMPTRHSRIRDETPPRPATQQALHAALHGIGLSLLQGAGWKAALADPEWAGLTLFLHCERDKLGECADDIDGLYFTPEEAQAAAAASPQANHDYGWKVFVSAMRLGDLAGDSKALSRLARCVKTELATRPAETLPGLDALSGGKAYLDTCGRRIVLFEDEGLALDGANCGLRRQTGIFRTPQGAGIFDEHGLVLIPPRFEDIAALSWNLAAARLGGLWGFVGLDGEWQIPPQFLEAQSFFIRNQTRVRSDQGWGVIDRRGRWIVAPAWDSLEWGPYGSFRVTRDGLCGYIDAAGQCMAGFQPEPYWLDSSTTFTPAPPAFVLYQADERHSYALADAQARRLTGYQFSRLKGPSEGLLVAGVEDEEAEGFFSIYGYIDTSGAWRIPARLAHACAFSEGLAQAGHAFGRFGYIDTRGEMVIAERFTCSRPFREGLAAVSTSTDVSQARYGYIDRSGAWAIGPRFDDTGPFSQGLAAAREGKFWGVIDRNGHWVIAPAFSRIDPFSDGHAIAALDMGREQRFGIIDRDGQWLVPPQYPFIGEVRRMGPKHATPGAETAWMATLLDEHHRWGGVKLGRGSDLMGEVVVAFECFSEDEVFRALDHTADH